jgi:hypothetical protein
VSGLLFPSNGQFAYADLLELTGLSAYGFYAEKMTAAGRNLVQKGMLGCNFASLSDLRHKFIEQTVVYSINHCAASGYGHIKDMLFQNGEAAGLDLSKYVPAVADKKLITKTVTSLNALQNYINDLSKETPAPSKSGGGGSSARGASSYVAPPFAAEQTETPVLTEKPAETETAAAPADMREAAWAEAYVQTLIREKIVARPSDGRFRPNDPITREEFTKMAALVLRLAIRDAETPFDDVPAEDWSAPYIAAAYKAGIIKGAGEALFGGKQPIVRQDVAAIVARAFSDKQASGGQLSERLKFTDEEEISHYAYDAVVNLCGLGVLSGYGDGAFAPFALCTRAEAAKILCLAADLD